MASNKDLIEQAATLAAELGIDIVTEGLNNASLAALVSDLRAKKQDASKDTAADEADVADEYVVAEGKAVTSRRGVLGEGADAFEDYFSGGKETFDALVANGTIVKKG